MMKNLHRPRFTCCTTKTRCWGLAMALAIVASAQPLSAQDVSGIWQTDAGEYLLLCEREQGVAGIAIGEQFQAAVVMGQAGDGSLQLNNVIGNVLIAGEYDGDALSGTFFRSPLDGSPAIEIGFEANRIANYAGSAFDGIWQLSTEVPGADSSPMSVLFALTLRLNGDVTTLMVELELDAESGLPTLKEIYLGEVSDGNSVSAVGLTRGRLLSADFDEVEIAGTVLTPPFTRQSFTGLRVF